MFEQIFELLQKAPALSIALGMILTGFLAWVFRDTITLYLKKKYNLHTTSEVLDAVQMSSSNTMVSAEYRKSGRSAVNIATHVDLNVLEDLLS